MNEQTTLMDSLVETGAAVHTVLQQQLDDHTRELGIEGVRNVRSILQNARQPEASESLQPNDLVAEPKAA